MKCEITGLPRQKLIGDFHKELNCPLVELERDRAFDEKLILWLGQIGDGVNIAAVGLKIKQMLPQTKVIEARRSSDGKIVAEYSLAASDFKILAKFEEDGVLSAYTLVPDTERVDDVSANLYGVSDREETDKEAVVDFCRTMKYDEGCHITLGNDSALTVGAWTLGEEGREWFDLTCMFGADEELWIDTIAESREDMLLFVKTYLDRGLSAAQQGRKWWSHLAEECFER